MIQEEYAVIELRSLTCVYIGEFLDCWEKFKELRLMTDIFGIAILKREDWENLKLLGI